MFGDGMGAALLAELTLWVRSTAPLDAGLIQPQDDVQHPKRRLAHLHVALWHAFADPRCCPGWHAFADPSRSKRTLDHHGKHVTDSDVGSGLDMLWPC